MLILTRREEEGVKIGDNVRVVILEIKGKQVKIGIMAPRETSIYRDEVYAKIVEENKLAASANSEELGQLVNIWKEKHSKKEGE